MILGTPLNARWLGIGMYRNRNLSTAVIYEGVIHHRFIPTPYSAALINHTHRLTAFPIT